MTLYRVFIQRLIAMLLVLFMPALLFSEDIIQDESEVSEYSRWEMVFHGSCRNLFTYQETDEFIKNSTSLPEEKRMAADLNRISLSPEINYGDSFTFHADMDVEAIFSNYNKTVPFDLYWRGSEYNNFTRPSVEPVYNTSICLLAEIRNIYVKMTGGAFTTTIGRQQVRFGSSKLWNPLDILNPLSPVHVEGSEEQNGIDALRLDWYPGESTELTCVVNPVRENNRLSDTSVKSSNYAVRFKTGFSECDTAVLAAYTAKRSNVGFDFQLVVLDGLLTGAILWSMPEEGKNFLQCGSGYEYTFGNGIYFLVEYFYNSLPVNDDDDLQRAVFLMSSEGIRAAGYYILANRIITYNAHYVSVAAGYDIHPLLRGECFGIYDVQGSGLFLNISLKLNALQDLDLTAGILSSFVKQNSRPSDFLPYDRKPFYYAAVDYYF